MTRRPLRSPPFTAGLAALPLALAACAAPAVAPPAASPLPATCAAAAPALTLGALHENDRVGGFVAKALYVDDDGRPRGARFVHDNTGFVFDYLAIETAPQAMVYAWTFPVSEGGEPHTQEHLLLGKGNAGRWLGNVEHSTFTEASAFTADRRTAYHFNTSAGTETFWQVNRTVLNALLHPDYSDEEIRREVRNFGVAKQPDGSLALDEKGTVYNEMVRTTEGSGDRSWYAMLRLLYGEGHPLSYEQGGLPEGLRELTPERIRAFHAAHYQLGNMGGTYAFPSTLALADVLAQMGKTLDALATPGSPKKPLLDESSLPPTHPAPPGTIRVVEYPYASTDNPSGAMLAWPANRALDVDERTVLELFASTFAGGQSSSLYRAVVDRNTRVLDLGATDTWAWVRDEAGQPVYVGLESVAAAHADEASMATLRNLVHAELEKIAALRDGSPELVAFNERVKARVAERRRQADKMLDTPPLFGTRGTGENWVEALDDLGRTGRFVRTLTFKEGLGRAEALASSTKNEWRDRIRTWGLLEAPYVVVGKPSPELRARLDRDRTERIEAELSRLEAKYGTKDAQEALSKRLAEIDAASDAIAKAEKDVPLAPLAADPPMTYDDGLHWTSETRGGVPRVASTFEMMKSATVGLNLRLDDVPDESLPWLAALPSLMTKVGVIHDGKPIAYDEVEDRLRAEVLGVDVHYSTDWSTKRAELAVEAAGNDEDETKRALGWARDFLTSPDWRAQNLPRIKDVVEERLTRLRDTMNRPEEDWVEDVEHAYRGQDSRVLSHASSFLTRTHDALVLSWRLEGGPDAKGVAPVLTSLAGAGKKLDRDGLTKLAAALASADERGKVEPKVAPWVKAARALPKPAQSRLRKAGRDLGHVLSDVPDASLVADWAELCHEMATAVARPPEEALSALTKALASIRHAPGARVWVVGSTKHQAAITGDIDATLATLDPEPAPHVVRASRPRVLERARARGLAGDPTFIALMNPCTANGSLVHTAPSIGPDEASEDALTSFLAVNVFDGEGTQSFYKRIWGAALAYSGYLSDSVHSHRLTLYSDRCADLSQLLRFVDGEVRRAPDQPGLVDYSVVRGFWSYAADTFEARARAIAIDLAEGRTPDKVRAFRARLLALRNKHGLAEAMRERYVPAMSAVIPSLAGGGPLAKDASYFVTGPESAVATYEKEIRRTRGEKINVLRLWARDFWDVEDVGATRRK